MFFNNEKEVEFFYWSALEKIGRQMDKDFSLTAANKTDGYFSAGSIKAICEIKHGLDFSSASNVARVIIQALYYIKSRQKAGLESPSSIFVGDDDEYFIVSVKQFSDLLDSSYNNEMDPKWEISPSSAYRQNTKLFQELFVRQIPLMIKRLDDRFDSEFVKNRLVALASNENIKTKLNAESIKKPFHYFTQSVLINGESIKDHVKIKLFFAAITGSEDAIYLRGRIRFEGKDYPVNDSYYAGFVNVYQTKYKASERESFIASMDNLIKEEARRFHGAYFTPKILVDYAHETITKQLGDNWRGEYVVWDPAAGTLNLTRDYQFRELYCSTLFQEELDLASDYNPEAIKFQFDFLNDEFIAKRDGGKIPDGLFDAVTSKTKKLLILMNPPYGAPGNGFGKGTKSNVSNTKARSKMADSLLSAANKDLYTQFLFKFGEILEGENKIMAHFTKSNFLRTSGMSKFALYYKVKFDLLDNFAFDSGLFEGTSNGWPVLFSVWKRRELLNVVNTDTKINYIKVVDGNVEFDRISTFYLVDEDISLTKYARRNSKPREVSKPVIVASMPTTIKEMREKTGTVYQQDISLGYFLCSNNTVKKVSTQTALFSLCYSDGQGLPMKKEDLFDYTVVFSARKLTVQTLYNFDDEFFRPDELHGKFNEFKNDSLVYSLFNVSSYQSSLRKVGYDSSGKPINYPTFASKGNINVYNEWFFLSHQEITNLADENDFSELYQDTKGQKDRHVHLELERLIGENKLSPEALAVLEAGRKLFRDTFPIRAKLHSQFPEYHLNAWDAGYWQLRTALERAGMGSILEDLKAKYEALENRMRPLVYELGFLKGNQ